MTGDAKLSAAELSVDVLSFEGVPATQNEVLKATV